jgi:hypothetical protein
MGLGVAGETGPQGATGPQGPTGSPGLSEETIGLYIDNTPDLISTGSKGYRNIAYDSEILEWAVLASGTGSIQFDVKKSSFATYPNFLSIVNTDYPNLTNQTKNQNTGVTMWQGFTAGDVVEFVINSNTDIKKVGLFIKIRKV